MEMKQRYLTDKVFHLPGSMTEEVDNRVKQMRRAGVDDLVSLGVGEPCFDTPPNIKQASVEALLAGDTKYQPTAGAFPLREAICNKLLTDNEIRVDPENVLVTAGGKFAIYLAFQAVLGPGDKVLIPEPAWVTYEPAAVLAGAGARLVATDAERGFELDLDLLDRAFDSSVKLVVLNSPNNPTGALLDRESMAQVCRMARDRSALVLSDEVYEYQVYEGRPYSPASEFDNVITVNAFSKSHAMTGWRLGYVAAPPEVVEGMIRIYQHSTSCVTAFAQAGGLAALTQGESLEAVEAMRRGYARRRELMLELISVSDYLSLPSPPQGAFYCFPRFRPDVSSSDLAANLLEEAHVATLPGAAFGPSGEGHLRLSYAASLEDIREAFRRMDDYFARF